MSIGPGIAGGELVVLDATGHRAIGPFSAVMLFFVIPLTVITFGVVTVRELWRGSADEGRDVTAA